MEAIKNEKTKRIHLLQDTREKIIVMIERQKTPLYTVNSILDTYADLKSGLIVKTIANDTAEFFRICNWNVMASGICFIIQ